MSETFWGVLIGVLATLAGNFLSHYFTQKRDEKQWERQQKAENDKWNRERELAKETEAKTKKEQITALYQESLQYLSLLAAKDYDEEKDEDVDKVTGDKRIELIEKAQKSLALLALRTDETSPTYFHNSLKDFTTSPNRDNAERLRNIVIELSAEDEEFPFRSKAKKPVKELKGSKEDEKEFHILVDKDFRKEQLIEGIKLPSQYIFTKYRTKKN